MNAAGEVAFRGAWAHWWTTMTATAWAYATRSNAYLIDILRWPVFPLLYFATFRITYGIAGQTQVDGADAVGFLLVGIVGLIAWTATIWSSGYAIEYERAGGTAAALFLSPASRTAVIAGYGLGSVLWLGPSYIVVLLLGLVSGARLHIADPLALLAALLGLAAASLASGFAFASLFILSRRANVLANALQMPIYLLAGFLVPRAALPAWLQPVSALLPISHAIDALRASSLLGASLGDLAPALLMTWLTVALWTLVGAVSLRRVEHVAKRLGQLDLY